MATAKPPLSVASPSSKGSERERKGKYADLYESKLPLDPQVISTCEEFNLDSTTVVLNGGEDYELLFTVAQEDFPKIKANPNFTVIGHMTDSASGANLVTRADEMIPLKAQGWNALEH